MVNRVKKLLSEYRFFAWSLLIVGLAFFFRFYNIELKPPHADEGVNGFFVNQIWDNGYFTYDPNNYHGPLHFYLLHLSEKIFGFGIHSFRYVTSAFGVATIILILRQSFIGNTRLWFALLVAISPGMVFFSRSSIHEAGLVFFEILAIFGFFLWREKFSKHGMTLLMIGVFGAALMKETFVIFIFANLCAWLLIELNQKYDPSLLPTLKKSSFDSRYITISILCGFAALLIIFSGFLKNPKGFSDFWLALLPWFKTGVSGSGHNKPFWYWTMLMVRYEWPSLVGLVLVIPSLLLRDWKIRFVTLYGLINLFIYSWLPYKTPWCIINLLWPFLYLTGFWISFIFDHFRRKTTIIAFSLILFSYLSLNSFMSSWQLNFKNYAKPSEPYVYVQTKEDFKFIENLIQIGLQHSPLFQNAIIQLNLNDCWPLPWYLSHFPNLKFGNASTPIDSQAEIFFTEVSTIPLATFQISDFYNDRIIDFRDARPPMRIYWRKTLAKDLK